MADPVLTATEASEAAPAAFVPEPLPPSSFADPTKARRAVPLTNPVVYKGKTWSEIHVRRFTVGQISAVLRNWAEARKADPDAPLQFPSFVDAKDVEVPEDLMRLLDDDDMTNLRKVGQDFLPQRFRVEAEETLTTTDQNDSTPTSGDTTEAQSGE